MTWSYPPTDSADWGCPHREN